MVNISVSFSAEIGLDIISILSPPTENEIDII